MADSKSPCLLIAQFDETKPTYDSKVVLTIRQAIHHVPLNLFVKLSYILVAGTEVSLPMKELIVLVLQFIFHVSDCGKIVIAISQTASSAFPCSALWLLEAGHPVG